VSTNRGVRLGAPGSPFEPGGFDFSFFDLVAQPLLLALSFEGAVHISPLGSFNCVAARLHTAIRRSAPGSPFEPGGFAFSFSTSRPRF